MAPKFMVGGSEAPLTPFTIAQMQALKIYTTEPAGEKPEYPCRALDLQKPANSMVLGEGASMACLEAGVSDRSLAIVEGIGYATEILEHNVSLSTDARCFQQSMRMALGTLAPEEVDVLVLHAPGTMKGDLAEYRAIEKVFGNKLPALTTNKWKIGHTFGASGMLSVEMAILMLRRQEFIKVPYLADPHVPETIKRVMVNAVGFGGNAVSVLLKAI
jgi:3-oxoacyl-(acyl-carrier-protein) synthase